MSVTIINTLSSAGALAYANRYANPASCFNDNDRFVILT